MGSEMCIRDSASGVLSVGVSGGCRWFFLGALGTHASRGNPPGVTSNRTRVYRTAMLPVTRKRKTSSFQDLCARLTELEMQQAAVRRALEERMTLASGRVDFTTTLNSLRGGYVSIVEALSEQLPDVFRTEVLPKLDLRATLNLAQVSMSFRDAVWSVDGVRSMKAKMKRKGRLLLGCPSISNPCENPMYYAAAHGNLTAVEAILCSGEDVNQPTTDKADTALHLAAYYLSLIHI